MVKSLILTCFCLSLLSGPAMGHEIGFGDQVLQPIIELQSLLALLAVGLLYRQQPEVPINRVVALLLGLGLTVGLSCKVYLNPAHSQAIFALGIAGLAGSLVALAYPGAIGALSIFILSLGVSIGTNLSFESTDWIDLTQSLLGAFVGAIAVLYVIATMTVPTSRVMHQISVRVAGSWIVASAIMVLTLEVRNLTGRPLGRMRRCRGRTARGGFLMRLALRPLGCVATLSLVLLVAAFLWRSMAGSARGNPKRRGPARWSSRIKGNQPNLNDRRVG